MFTKKSRILFDRFSYCSSTLRSQFWWNFPIYCLLLHNISMFCEILTNSYGLFRKHEVYLVEVLWIQLILRMIRKLKSFRIFGQILKIPTKVSRLLLSDWLNRFVSALVPTFNANETKSISILHSSKLPFTLSCSSSRLLFKKWGA